VERPRPGGTNESGLSSARKLPQARSGLAPLSLFGDVTRGARRKARHRKHFRHRASPKVTAPIGAVTRRTPRPCPPLPDRGERRRSRATGLTNRTPGGREVGEGADGENQGGPRAPATPEPRRKRPCRDAWRAGPGWVAALPREDSAPACRAMRQRSPVRRAARKPGPAWRLGTRTARTAAGAAFPPLALHSFAWFACDKRPAMAQIGTPRAGLAKMEALDCVRVRATGAFLCTDRGFFARGCV
jgi:hypothetical protein